MKKFVFICCLFVLPIFGNTLKERAEKIDNPVIGGQLSLNSITFGNIQINLEPGSVIREMYAGDEKCGVYIEGDAILTFTLNNKFTIPVAKRNFKRILEMDVATDNNMFKTSFKIKNAAIWSFKSFSNEKIAKSNAPTPKWITKLFNKPLFSRPSTEIIPSNLNGFNDTVYCLIKGKKDLLYSYDNAFARVAFLYLIEEAPSGNKLYRRRHYLSKLAYEPIGREIWDRFAAPAVAFFSDFEVVNDKKEHAIVKSTRKLKITANNTGCCKASLIDNTVIDSQEKPVNVTKVLVNGEKSDYLFRDGSITIKLPKVYNAGETLEIYVENEGILAERPNGDNYWYLGTWSWYPEFELNGEFSPFNITLKVKKPYTPFASGDVVSKTEEGEFNVLKTSIKKPMQWPVVAAGNYNVMTKKQDGITCNLCSYVFAKKKACNKLLNFFFAAEDYYSKIYGLKYPFTTANVIEVNQWGFGQAPPGVIFITKEIFNPAADTMNRIYSQGVNARYVHEIAHAWWGHIVKMDSMEEQWLTESFAEYSSALCMQSLKGGKKGRKEFEKIYKHWRGGVKMLGEGQSIYLANYIGIKNQEDSLTRTRLLYHKGPIVLHALRLELQKMYGSKKEGDRRFFGLLRSFLKTFNYKWGRTKDLIGILNVITKKDWTPWFEKYVYGTEVPPFAM